MNTMKPTTQNLEMISALADGQLASEDFAAALAICEADDQALESWNAYHLIGDVLRSPGLAPQRTAVHLSTMRWPVALWHVWWSWMVQAASNSIPGQSPAMLD